MPCNKDPRAPHGFDRTASHSADRYVCECEGWIAPDDVWTTDVDKLRAERDDARRELAAYKQAMTDAQVSMLETIGGIEQRVRELLAANA